MSWRSLKFVPVGGDDSQAITRKDKGFMHLCEVYRYEPEKFSGYRVHDIHGMFDKHGHNNVDVSWSDFGQALIKYTMKQPPEKPSVFQGKWYPPEHTIEIRKRLLAALLRKYVYRQDRSPKISWSGYGADGRRISVRWLDPNDWPRREWTWSRPSSSRRFPYAVDVNPWACCNFRHRPSICGQ